MLGQERAGLVSWDSLIIEAEHLREPRYRLQAGERENILLRTVRRIVLPGEISGREPLTTHSCFHTFSIY